ncbi:MAG: flagellar hook-basal body complex protein [Polymorphobacter sp.]
MDRLIYTALTGLATRGRSQTITANNLANGGTTGFRREIVAAEGRYLAGPVITSRVQSGAPSVATPHDPGKIDPTGRDLDIALGGEAWLAVQGPVVRGEPTEAYTRRGDLGISPGGVLQNGDGRAVLGQGGTPVTVPAGAPLSIGSDGSLTVRVAGVNTPLGKLKLVDGTALTNLDKAGDGLFATREPLPVDPAARLTSGALERSNVQTAGALAELVEESRGFEVNARLLGIAKDIDERTTRLMAFDSQ